MQMAPLAKANKLFLELSSQTHRHGYILSESNSHFDKFEIFRHHRLHLFLDYSFCYIFQLVWQSLHLVLSQNKLFKLMLTPAWFILGFENKRTNFSLD